jgi:hypothetical protein
MTLMMNRFLELPIIMHDEVFICTLIHLHNHIRYPYRAHRNDMHQHWHVQHLRRELADEECKYQTINMHNDCELH